MFLGSITRRQAISRVARVGAGTVAALGIGSAVCPVEAQVGGVQPILPPPNPQHPTPPTWDTELREVAPNAYAYIQAGGPGRNNAGVATAGVFVGNEGVMVGGASAHDGPHRRHPEGHR